LRLSISKTFDVAYEQTRTQPEKMSGDNSECTYECPLKFILKKEEKKWMISFPGLESQIFIFNTTEHNDTFINRGIFIGKLLEL